MKFYLRHGWHICGTQHNMIIIINCNIAAQFPLQNTRLKIRRTL